MPHIKIFRISLLILIASVICFSAYTSYQFEKSACMKVPILSGEGVLNCCEKADIDLSGSFFFKNEPAAIDQQSKTIYISQSISEHTHYLDLEGNLALAYQDFHLYFAPDPYFDNLMAAMADGHRFRLLAVNSEGIYTEYYVLFTTLPVLRMDEQNGNFGKIYLWAPEDPNLLRYSTTTSFAEWHVRGETSSSMPKKPWRLSLKTSNHTKNQLSLLGLGKDDDWILNAMYLDDTRLKEQLFMELWNQMAADAPYNYSMADAEYVEVVCNQEYLGLYLLHRRVDRKYLELSSDCILAKGSYVHKMDVTRENYKIVSSPFSEDETFALLQPIWNGDCSLYDINNFLDVNLFLHFASAFDNCTYKNMFYLLTPSESGYHVSLIPWDTDMSFGTCWNEGFVYNYDKSINSTVRRMEFKQMQILHPDLDTRMADRWQKLRQNVLSEENILSHLAKLEAHLAKSCMPTRDIQHWGTYYGNEDTANSLQQYIREKLILMDEYYTQ